MKMLIHMCMLFQNDTYNCEQIFLDLGNFHRVRITGYWSGNPYRY